METEIMVASSQLKAVAHSLYAATYESAFGGKRRGAFRISRAQLCCMLQTKTLDSLTLARLNGEAIGLGLMVIDLGDGFACVEQHALANLRQPATTLLMAPLDTEDDEEEEDELDQRPTIPEDLERPNMPGRRRAMVTLDDVDDDEDEEEDADEDDEDDDEDE